SFVPAGALDGVLGPVLPGEGGHALRQAREVDARDPGVGERRTHEAGVTHAGQHVVGDVAALAREETGILDPDHPGADQTRLVGDGHASLLSDARRMASTMKT